MPFSARRMPCKHDKPGKDIYELSNQNFSGEDNRPEEAALFYELRNGLTRAAYPGVRGRHEAQERHGLRRSSRPPHRTGSAWSPRATTWAKRWSIAPGVTSWVMGSPNRSTTWGPHNAPTHPELLDKLAAEFKKASYNVKQLIRWITLSEPYGLSSRFGTQKQAGRSVVG